MDGKMRMRSFILALCLLPCCLAVQEDAIHNFLTVIEDEEGDSQQPQQPRQPVSVMWGLHDASATVGKLFHYTLPKEAFQGDITSYTLAGVESGELPAWLMYDENKQVLQGIPGHEEQGQQFVIEVTASAHFTNDTISQAKDMFTISVNEEPSLPISSATPLKDAESLSDSMRPIWCLEGSPVTMVTVIIDADLSSMQPPHKIGMMKGMCSHLKLPIDLLKLLPVGNRPMFDSSALVAGPGDVKKPKNAASMMQWEVGCGNVNANHMPILQQVESTSHDGSMSQAVGHGIIGWHVTNNKPHSAHRMKRQVGVMPTATQLPSVAPPTHQEGPTYVVEEPEQPVTRSVPNMVSPTFPGDIQPSRTKHHHRTKTRGRHHQHKSKSHKPKHSPTRKPTRTKHTRTPMPTPTVLLISPTRVIDVMPTIIDTSMERPRPTYSQASPGVSRTEIVLEPSMTPVIPPRATTTTEVLPTRTYVVQDPLQSTEPFQPAKTDTTAKPTRITEKPGKAKTTPAPTAEEFNFAPILMDDIKTLTVQVGEILNYRIPEGAFMDFEDGNTNNLELLLLTVDGLTLPRNSWVKFNQSSQILYGLPMTENEGTHAYTLAAIDSQGKITKDQFEIVVQRRPHELKINHEFSITLDADYRQFKLDVNKRLEIARKLAQLYGDNDVSKITVTNIAEGSVVYAWTNNSVPYEPCPVRIIQYLQEFLITKDQTLNPALVEKMEPYRVTKAGVAPRGVCTQGGHDPSMPTVESSHKPPEGPGMVETPRETSDEDVLVTTVIPAVIIAAMLLLAGCIACILYRKKRKGKLSDEDQHTFVNKGVPIIFADELEEKPSPPTKPLILQDEKPPMPPPGYNRGGSTPSTPQSDHKTPLDFEDDRDDLTSPLYQPPPPFTPTNRDARYQSRGRQQASRHPPPYVPP